jgi:predicted N-acetyltransferase YhbS
MDLSIRTLSLEDLPRLVAMDYASTGRHRDAWYREALDRSQGGSIAMSLGAEHDGILVGALLGAVRYGEFGQPEPVAEVDTMIVDPNFKSQGVGRGLMNALVDNLRALRVERLRTQVDWTEQDLLGFFGRYGFAPTPRLVLEYKVDL